MSTHLSLPGNGKRLIFDLSDFGLPEIPYLAAQNLPFTTTGLPQHSHRERVEINHILKGERVYHVDGTDYHLRGNHMFITWPHELHGSGQYLHGRGVHFWMQALVPEPGKPFLGFAADRAEPLLRAFWSIPRRQFKAAPAMRDLYARMLVICHNGPSDLASLELSALLCQWFMLLIQAAAEEGTESISPDIAKALAMIEQAGGNHISVSDLAEAACLSESRFKGKFREQLGVPPKEYHLRRRTEMAAKMLLQRKKTLTEIAYELGFSSAQHLSVTFKKFFGQSPLLWMKYEENTWLNDLAAPLPDGPADDTLRPWVDDQGQLHGYVPASLPVGVHPDC